MSWFKTPKQAPPAVTVYRQPGTRDDYEEKVAETKPALFNAAQAQALVKKAKESAKSEAYRQAESRLGDMLLAIRKEAVKGNTSYASFIDAMPGGQDIHVASCLVVRLEALGYKATQRPSGGAISTRIDVTW